MTTTTVAATILEQLGGAGRLTAMIGAKHLIDGGPALEIRFAAKATDGINHLQIILEPSDTYTVNFYRIGKVRGFAECYRLASVDGVHAENLRGVIEARTGLRLAL